MCRYRGHAGPDGRPDRGADRGSDRRPDGGPDCRADRGSDRRPDGCPDCRADRGSRPPPPRRPRRSSRTGGSSPAIRASRRATPGGTITVAYVGPCCVNVDNNNPMSQGGDYEWTHLHLEHLLTYGVNPTTVDKNPFGGQYGDLVPELADSWEVSDDHLTWTFKLHPGVKWHDGTDFTADDVKFSIELCLDPTIGVPCYPGSATRACVTGAQDVIDGNDPGPRRRSRSSIRLTITIRTDTPNALLPYGVMDLFIVQKASVECDPARPRSVRPRTGTAPTTVQVVGTGPFKVTGYAAGQSMEVSSNDDYWRGKPFLDKIIRREFKDIPTALLAFDAGEVDVTYITADDVERENQSTIGTLLPGPSGVDLDVVLQPA